MSGPERGGRDRRSPGDPRDPLERVFDALRDPIRREILATLVRGGGPTDEDAVVASIAVGMRDDQRLRIDLLHVHLPKLVQMGYVEWVPGGAIRRGPRFEEIATVVEVLLANEDALPARW